MKVRVIRVLMICRKPGWPRSSHHTGRRTSEQGFTLVELLIVTTVLPLIIGALSVGLISVFSLQSGVSSRLSNTTDAQVVAADFQTDVQGAAQITNGPKYTVHSGSVSGTQLLGLLSNVGQANQLLVSYVSVTMEVDRRPRTHSKRIVCNGLGGNLLTGTVTTLSSNLPVSQPARRSRASQRADLCSNTLAGQQYVSSQNVAQVSMTIAEPAKTPPKLRCLHLHGRGESRSEQLEQ